MDVESIDIESIDIESIDIDRNEILRYLGYGGEKMSHSIKKMLEQAIMEAKAAAQGKYVYKIFPLDKKAEEVSLVGSTVQLRGKDIAHHLKDSSRCVLMAATLGVNYDRLLTYATKTDLAKSLMLDACGSVLVEALCNKVEQQIKAQFLQEGYHLTWPYSPGYGDLPLTVQDDINNTLNGYRQIGLTVTENHLLIPRKSITAIMGIQEKAIKTSQCKCDHCDDENCSMRK